MDNLQQTLRPNSTKNGLVLGLILLFVNIFSFYFITRMASSLVMILIVSVIFSFIIPIVLRIIFCFGLRKEIGGYWDFRQAVTGIFIMFFAAYITQTVGNDLVFAKFIEPHMAQKTEDAMMAATTAMLEKTGADQTLIDEKKASIEKQFDDQKNVTVRGVVQRIAISIIFIFVFAVIFAALFKKDPPLIVDSPYQEPEV